MNLYFALPTALFLCMLASSAYGDQSCTLRENTSSSISYSPIPYASSSSICEGRGMRGPCSFVCSCQGYNASLPQQLVADCTITTEDSLFWWSFIFINASALNVSYSFRFDNVTAYANISHANVSLARAIPGRMISYSEYAVAYAPLPYTNISSMAVEISGML